MRPPRRCRPRWPDAAEGKGSGPSVERTRRPWNCAASRSDVSGSIRTPPGASTRANSPRLRGAKTHSTAAAASSRTGQSRPRVRDDARQARVRPRCAARAVTWCRSGATRGGRNCLYSSGSAPTWGRGSWARRCGASASAVTPAVGVGSVAGVWCALTWGHFLPGGGDSGHVVSLRSDTRWPGLPTAVRKCPDVGSGRRARRRAGTRCPARIPRGPAVARCVGGRRLPGSAPSAPPFARRRDPPDNQQRTNSSTRSRPRSHGTTPCDPTQDRESLRSAHWCVGFAARRRSRRRRGRRRTPGISTLRRGVAHTSDASVPPQRLSSRCGRRWPRAADPCGPGGGRTPR